MKPAAAVLTRIGELHTTVVASERATLPDEVQVILCHGYGAPGDDLVPLASALSRRLGDDAARVRFYFPEAPDEAGASMGRAWWQIDPDRLRQMSMGVRPQPGSRRKEKPEGLPRARRMLAAMINDVMKARSCDASRVVLGGFSQGAMLTTDLALRMEEAPAGLVIMSGTLLDEDEWKTHAARRRGLPVLQSHGTADPLLAFDDARALEKLLRDAGMDVEFIEFRGGHTIPGDTVDGAARVIRRALEGATSRARKAP